MTRWFALNAWQPKMRFAPKPVKLQFDNVYRFPVASRDPVGVAARTSKTPPNPLYLFQLRHFKGPGKDTDCGTS
jgi:hypothetical protein